MAERISRTLLDHRAEVVSTLLAGDLHVAVQARNGYIGLDLCDGIGMVRTLATGTKREVYAYLGAMVETLDIIGRTI